MNQLDSQQSPPRRVPLRRITFGLLVVIFAVVILRAAKTSQTYALQADELQLTRDSLQTMVDQIDAQRAKGQRDKQAIWDLLGHCRTAADVPNLQSNRIVAQRGDVRSIRFYLPSGKHSLIISCSWKITPTSKTSKPPGNSANEDSESKTWKIPLLGDAGYQFAFQTQRAGGPVTWNVESNDGMFVSQSGALPLDEFAHRGSSYPGKRIAAFPNQLQQLNSQALDQLADWQPAVTIMTGTMRGSQQKQQCEVTFELKISSEGPACVSASDAITLINRKRSDLLMPYQGGGKYDLRLPAAK